MERIWSKKKTSGGGTGSGERRMGVCFRLMEEKKRRVAERNGGRRRCARVPDPGGEAGTLNVDVDRAVYEYAGVAIAGSPVAVFEHDGGRAA